MIKTVGLHVTATAELLRLPTHTAISLSLAVSELIADTFKYAFAPGGRGTVRVRL